MVTFGCAEYGALHATWRHKRTHMDGRPRTILRGLATRNADFAAANPDAASFEPLIADGDHPEFPSGSCAVYKAFAVAGDEWFQSRLNFSDASKNTGPLTFTVPAGKFYWNDGPEADVTLRFDSLDHWVSRLPLARVYAGVHWEESGDAGLGIGEKVGAACSRLLSRLRDGDMTATYTSASREPVNAFNN